MHRLPRALAVWTGLVLALSACGAATDDDGSAEPPSDVASTSGTTTDGGLAEALSLLPADTTVVDFTGRAAAAERLGVGDVENPTDPDALPAYVEAFGTDPVPSATRFAQDEPLDGTGALTDGDVVWGAFAALGRYPDDGGSFNVYRFDDDVDLGAVADDLEDLGFERTDEGGTVLLEPTDAVRDGLDGFDLEGGYPGGWAYRPVALDAEDHLVVTDLDAEPDDALGAIRGDDEPLADAGTFDDVLGAVDGEVQYAYLNAYDPCNAAFTLDEFTDEEAAYFEGLGSPVQNAYLVAVPDDGGDPETVSLLDFDDPDAAQADAEARADYVADGVGTHATPVADLGSAEVSADGDLVRLDLTLDTPSSGVRYATLGDPFVVCGEPIGLGYPGEDDG